MQLLTLLGLLALGICSLGCSQQRVEPVELSPRLEENTTPVNKVFTYRVGRNGESLSQIAEHYTGLASNWPKIVRATPWINSETIQLDQLLLIPANLVITRKPMILAAHNVEPEPSATKIKAPSHHEQKPDKKKKDTLESLKARGIPNVISINLEDAPKVPGIDTSDLFARERLWNELLDGLDD